MAILTRIRGVKCNAATDAFSYSQSIRQLLISSSMADLCSTCLEHFSFTRPDLVDGVKKLKQEAIIDAISGGHHDEAVQSLQDDLQRYERAVLLRSEIDAPTPWHLDQSFKMSFPVRQMLNVWERDHARPWGLLCESAEFTGCPICQSLVSMIRHVLGHNVPEATRLTSVWIFQKGSMLPSMLQFRVYIDEACSVDKLSLVLFYYCSMAGFTPGKRSCLSE